MEYFSEGSGLVFWFFLLVVLGAGTIGAFRFSSRKSWPAKETAVLQSERGEVSQETFNARDFVA